MPFSITIEEAQKQFPSLKFIKALTPSEQKAAFHVVDSEGNNLCLKIINPNYEIARLNREIHALQTVVHPNVAKLKEYVFSSKNGQQEHYMIEEYIEGSDMSSILGKAWNLTDVISFFSQLCDGLEALRKTHIVHRDLKPNNIRVRPNGVPVIIDFGWARILNLPDATATIEGARFGTPIYFAPEQFRGTKRDIDHRTDLFALGIIMFQAITGTQPFYTPTMTMNELEDAVCTSSEYENNSIFRSLDAKSQLIINKLLAKERINRPSAAGQVKMFLNIIGGKN
ncbi:MAG: serine/threonine-protein kinase [Planctomycetota bacterium]|jgi:serine/threonine-protein kinase